MTTLNLSFIFIYLLILLAGCFTSIFVKNKLYGYCFKTSCSY